MPFSLTLPDGYGYVAGIALGIIPFMSFMHGYSVTKHRYHSGIPYPNAYATPEEAKSNPKAYKFNCAQRAHGNFLENMPQTIFYTLFAGAFYPQATIYTSLAWVACRIIFGWGYIEGSRAKGADRLWGMGFWLAQGGLWAMCLYAAYTELM